MLEEEGLGNVYERHERLARATQAGLVALGFTLYAREGFRSHTVTSAVPPPGVDVAALRSLLKNGTETHGRFPTSPRRLPPPGSGTAPAGDAGHILGAADRS